MSAMSRTPRTGDARADRPADRIVVALTGAPGNDALVRRAARLARRRGGELLGVHVRTADDSTLADEQLDELRRTLVALGGRYHEVVDADVAGGLVRFARQEGASEIVLGESRRTPWERLVHGSVERRVIGAAGRLDVHVLDPGGASEQPAARLHRGRRPLVPHRTLLAWLLAPLLLAGVTALLASLRDRVDLSAALPLYLLVVALLAVVGGRAVALVAAGAAFLCANWWLTPPVHTWKIAHTENVVALAAFVAVAAVVSTFVAVARERTSDAERARAEAESLARLSATFADDDPLGSVVLHLRATFGFDAASVLRRSRDGWSVEASAGRNAPTSPDGAVFVHEVAPNVVLACTGRRLSDDDRRVLRTFTVHLAAAVERRLLARDAARAASLESTNALRTALLQSLSHDLRTPLAAIKANVSNLRDPDIAWPPAERDEFLASIEEEVDHLTHLVTNLVDLGRIQTGELHPRVRAVSLEEVVPAVVHAARHTGVPIEVDLPVDLPDVAVDAALLERAVANVVTNAVRFSPPGTSVAVRARCDGDHVTIDVVDHGPGIAPDQRAAVLRPFQRLDDARHESGVGLGLAITDGFTRAMQGTLSLLDTPGGGLTARITVPVALAATVAPVGPA
jgi:two-component system sensor histidine kinase KdpD